MLLYLRRRARAQVEPGLLARDLLVRLSQQVLESHGEELVLAHVYVVRLPDVAFLDLVLENTPPQTTAPYPLEVVIVDGLLFLGSDAIGLALDLFLSLFERGHG